MAKPAVGQVIVVSPDRDFAEPLAEHVKATLQLSCVIIADKNDVKQYIDSALIVVSSEMLEESLPCPIIAVKNPPVRLQVLLDDMALVLHNPNVEEMDLGHDYRLQIRHKQLSHVGDKSVDLTDKEAQLLQSLAEAKGQVVAKDQLLKTVWGFDEALDTHTLETHIYRLRGKFRELAEDEMIEAVEGGYKLKGDDEMKR